MSWQALAHLRWHGFIGLSFHDSMIIAPPAPPVECKLPHITFNVLNGLFLGALPSNADEGPVYGPLGIPFMGRTNDAGFITPHVSIPPNNSLLPITILLGSSESLLGSSKVKVLCHNLIWGTDEQDLSACTIPLIPLSTNIGCNDPLFVPLDFVIAPNTVVVSISLIDLLVMAIDLIVAALIEGFMELGGHAAKKAFKKVKTKRAAKQAGDEAYERALKHADLDEALRDGLRKQRAKVTGAPAPPPKPRRSAEEVAQAARERARKAVRMGAEPPPSYGPWARRLERLGEWKEKYISGNQYRLARTVTKAISGTVVEEILGSLAPGGDTVTAGAGV